MASELVDAIKGTLAESLRGAIGHGSWIHGDYAPGRSDLDLLFVLSSDPESDLVTRIGPVLAAVTQRHPEWYGRLELGFVTSQAVSDVVDGTGVTHQVARVSPGEPLHLVAADRHRVLDWEAASRGRLLDGGPNLLPVIPADLVHCVVNDHLRNWPMWVQEMTGDGLAYSVLTVCRAASYLSTRQHLSKRGAARWGVSAIPEWASLIRAALGIWYGPMNHAPLEFSEVESFVEHVAANWAAVD